MARDPVCGMQVNEDREAERASIRDRPIPAARRAASGSSTKTQNVIQGREQRR